MNLIRKYTYLMLVTCAGALIGAMFSIVPVAFALNWRWNLEVTFWTTVVLTTVFIVALELDSKGYMD